MDITQVNATIASMSEDEIKKTFVDGSIWEKSGRKRLYFNRKYLLTYYGYSWSYHNTGRVATASLDGCEISNSSMTKLLLSDEKFYIDLNAKRIFCNQDDEEYFLHYIASTIGNKQKTN